MKQPICWRSYTLACLLTDPCFTFFFSFCSQHQFHIIFLLSSSYFLITSLHLDLPKTYRSWYSRMDQVKFVEDSFQKI